MSNLVIPTTRVEILDTDQKVIAEMKALYQLNNQGMVLRYSSELSNYGRCTFRVSPLDPIFNTVGDILMPHAAHVRLRRGPVVVWQGALVDNSHRNKTFIENMAVEYEYYLDKMEVKRTSAVSYGADQPATDIGLHYRIFDSGTMAEAVTAIVSEAIAAAAPGSILSNFELGTIENPDFPDSFSDSAGNALTGPWTFSPDLVLQFDYQTVLYVLRSFGIYALADFAVVPNPTNGKFTFNFKKFYGNKQLGEVFTFGREGNIIDFDVPRLGKNMVNDLFGIATQPDGTILHSEKLNQTSIDTSGILQGVQGFVDVKDNNALTARLTAQLLLEGDLNATALNLLLDEKSYPIGQFGLGDLCGVKIDYGIIHYAGPRRIIGYSIAVHDTGREFVTTQTNVPNPKDLGNI